MDIVDELRLFHHPNKIRYGGNGDGGYVVADLGIKYDCYISAGIAEEESFTKDFLQAHSYIGKENSYAFDGTIDDYPWEYTSEIQFIKKNINNYNDYWNTTLEDLAEQYDNIFLNMDIEGYEFSWLEKLSTEHLKSFKQITIEMHGLNNDHWHDCSHRMPLSQKFKMINKLNNTHYLIHAHGNNHAGWMKVLYEKDYDTHNLWIPNVLEFTFLSKDCFDFEPNLNTNPLPIQGLDYPNRHGWVDLPLFTYPFVNK